MNNKTETQWDAMRRDRKYLPQTLSGNREAVSDQLKAIITGHGSSGYVDVMTDQIDVYVSGRKVGIYMP